MPLHTAASSRNMTGVQQLLQCGAEVNVRDNNGGTPLFAACEAKAHRSVDCIAMISATVCKRKIHRIKAADITAKLPG